MCFHLKLSLPINLPAWQYLLCENMLCSDDGILLLCVEESAHIANLLASTDDQYFVFSDANWVKRLVMAGLENLR